jgi:hypothetical protein
MGVVDAQVLEQLTDTFLDRKGCFCGHAFSSWHPVPHGKLGA